MPVSKQNEETVVWPCWIVIAIVVLVVINLSLHPNSHHAISTLHPASEMMEGENV